MNRTWTFALALLGIACGRPLPSADVNAETESGGGSSTTSTTSSTDTSGSESTGEPGESSDTFGFVPEHDVFHADQCNSWLQDCPDGEKCVPYSYYGGIWDANKCVPVLGDQAPGELCTYSGLEDSLDDCDATSFCWDVMEFDGQLWGICAAFCTGTPDDPECPEDKSCLLAQRDTINLCVGSCDPIAQDCGEGIGCYWVYDFVCMLSSDDFPPGTPCSLPNECAEGNVCVGAETLPACEGSSCCTAFCENGLGDAPCAAVPGTACVPFFEDGAAPPNYDHVGVCLSPP